MKILTVVGARPQFIKAAAGSRQIRKKHEEILVHTGQHFDDNMSAVFFREMGIPEPNYNMGISGGSHAEMTARMLVELEKIMINEKTKPRKNTIFTGEYIPSALEISRHWTD